ncbi:hypothetical protein BSKO_03551 [Bryopsis sp. KO-2023]|nr:hypothetical protein BSKO_03551 [Bryopsis sp. KO-2023]
MQNLLAGMLGASGSGIGDPSKFSGQAQKIWSFLDELAEKNPEEYKKFIEKQAQAAGVSKGKKENEAPQKKHAPMVVLTTIVESSGRFPPNITINIWKGKADARVTTKTAQTVDSEGLLRVRDWSKINVPIKSKGKLTTPVVGGRRMTVADVSVAPCAVEAAVDVPSSNIRPLLVEHATRFVELKHGLKLDRKERKLMISRDEADPEEIQEVNRRERRQRAEKAAEGTSASGISGSLLEELSSLAVSDDTSKPTQTGQQKELDFSIIKDDDSKKQQPTRALIQELN